MDWNLDSLTTAHPEVVHHWRVDACLDYKTTPEALALNGRCYSTKEQAPSVDGMRVSLLPITSMAMAMEAKDGEQVQLTVSVLAETREELEAIKGCRIYGSKTSKKETGRCYFKGCFDAKAKRGEEAGEFLRRTTNLTREVVLGPSLAADFADAVIKGRMNAQQWVEERLS
jgi:hypothetical protein